ncbi:MAG TPA: sugar ABC transporter permease [Kofleriaceae bacterium]|nr:sugar ABC transporter permease [Kofleriaceae bacterium]
MGPLFVTPALLLLVVIVVGPFLYTIALSFTDLSYALPDHDGHFVGFDNYRRLVREDPVFWGSFKATLRFVFVAVGIEMILGFLIALVLANQLVRRRFVLTLVLVPMMIAPVAVGLIGKLMLQGEFGMLTYYLRWFGIMGEQTAMLSDPDLAMRAVVLIDIWQWTPFVTLVMLAGMLSLPREPFEAAIMDGAGRLRILWDMTLPLLRPIIGLVLLLRSIDAFKEFDKVFILTGGGPGTATELLSIYTWRVNFRDWDLGYGAVCAFMVYLIVLILCSVFYKVISRRDRMADR